MGIGDILEHIDEMNRRYGRGVIMKRTIKEVYNIIKEKRDNAERDCQTEESRFLGKKPLLQGNIDAYQDVLCLIESSHLLELDKALEIIQSKDFIDLQLLHKCKSHYEYNRKVASKYAERESEIGLLTQEEYDLVKRVLL